ncbi:MAG: tetratricopeptide repeat protein [Bdellovibrio sp.]
MDQRVMVSPPALLEKFSFGYQEVIADILWIRAIQDFDYCEMKISTSVCKSNSWLFKMIDTVTNLSPQFRIPYAAGGLALTIIISDIDGATKIFEKGVKAFPKDWPILYRAAYHYLYEVKDKKRAAELLIQAGQNGAPPWVFSLAGRLYSDSGYIELAQSLLNEMIQTKQDPGLIKRLEDKINSMKK